MTLFLIITAYILNVFLNRWLNKILYQKCDIIISPLVWFIPVIITVTYLVVFVDKINIKIKSNWFTGKNW
jgi:hypothetical protein